MHTSHLFTCVAIVSLYINNSKITVTTVGDYHHCCETVAPLLLYECKNYVYYMSFKFRITILCLEGSGISLSMTMLLYQ